MTGEGVVAALLALDGTQITIGVLGAIPLTIAAVASLVSASNSRQAKKELRPNGGGSAYDRLTARLDSQDDDMADLKTAVADIAATTAVVIREMATEKVRRQYVEAELAARIEQEKHH